MNQISYQDLDKRLREFFKPYSLEHQGWLPPFGKDLLIDSVFVQSNHAIVWIVDIGNRPRNADQFTLQLQTFFAEALAPNFGHIDTLSWSSID